MTQTISTKKTFAPSSAPDTLPTVHLLRVAVPLVAIGVWYLVAPLTELVPSPVETLADLANGFLDGWIYPPLAATAYAVGVGFLIALLTGFPAGYLLGRSSYLNDVFHPIATALFAIPRIIFFPVFLMIFGIGFGAEVAMVAVSAFFPILMSTSAAVSQTNRTLLKLGRSLNASRWQTMSRIVIPDAGPSIMVGIRIGFSISFISVIIAQLFAAKEGLGLLIDRSYAVLNLPRMYAVVFLILAIALLGNLGLYWLERKLRGRMT